ncbi:hypothetical protein JCM10207_000802 [Rhodosporidiobolus poonsookiae]
MSADPNAPAAPPSAVAASPSASPHSAVIRQHYEHLFASLLNGLRALSNDAALESPALKASNGSEAAPSSWPALRDSLRASYTSPAAWITSAASSVQFNKDVTAVLAQLVSLGAERLAEGCLAEEEASLAGQPSAGVWAGVGEALSWVGAVKAGLMKEIEFAEKPALTLAPNHRASPASAIYHSGDPYISPQDASFGFTDASTSASTMMFVSPADVSGPSSAPNATANAPPADLHLPLGFAPPPPPGSLPVKKKARTSAPPAVPASHLSTSQSLSPSLSDAPAIPSAPGFAPAPSSYPAPKKRKPRSSAPAAPKRTATGVLKGKGVSEVYVPPPPVARAEGELARPQRKRKLPRALTFEQSSDPVYEEEEVDEGYGTVRGRGAGKGKGRASVPPQQQQDEEEIDELASDYEEEVASRASSIKPEEVARTFAIGAAVMAKYPNYNWWPSIVCDPRVVPASTQGKRHRDSYLVKSIPSGGDHRWVREDDSQIRAILDTELDSIETGVYATPPPASWNKYRFDLVDAARLVRNPTELADWFAHPTDLEMRMAAAAERKRVEKAIDLW